MIFDDTTEELLSTKDVVVDELTMHEQRTVIFYLLYAMDSFDYDVSLESVAANFAHGFRITIPHESAAFEAATGITHERHALDSQIEPLLANWRLDRLSTCTRLILRMALWELQHTDAPAMVVINEAVELTKSFAEQDAHKFVNGVLDEWVKRHKPEAISQ